MPPPYQVSFKPRALNDLAALPQAGAARVMERLGHLAQGLPADVKKLSQQEPGYRLRSGEWRALFDLDSQQITVYRVLHRREAYR